MKNKRVNSAWIVIPVLAILLIGIGIYTRHNISGTYYQKNSAKIKKGTPNFKKITFKDGNFTTDNNKKGTYKINDDSLKIKENNNKKTQSFVGSLSDNRSSFKITGVKYTKDAK